ncbi:CSC1-like protein [Dichanthelium oligosanthes]|uniref:CSC1-like protein n=1 Tax=Dichanthelium oligosanthes TaxID=888268 RepID=A0A1E5VY14_9POAL|nr:CSC1-like protein [Dichanthelium oligosanthes]
MATLNDIGLSAAFNVLTAIAFLLAFAFLRLQPINDRVYFPKWYLRGMRDSPISGAAVQKFVNLDARSYLKFLNWMPAALKMPQDELISHAGLDSVVYLRIYLTGLKIFVPITVLAFLVLVPVNWTNDALEGMTVVHSDIDKLSISNIPNGSKRFIAHLAMAYVITFWTCYVLLREYQIIANLRLCFLASEKRRPDQFTVWSFNYATLFLFNKSLCGIYHKIPMNQSVVYNANKLAGLVEKKKKMQNWLDYYLLKYERNSSERPTTKTGFLGCFGSKVDAIDYYKSEIEKIVKEEAEERKKVMKDPKSVVPAAFVSFRSRWGAAVCAQTQQTSNPTVWLTEWAPEPRDVYWNNLSIPFVSLTVRRLIIAVAFFFLNFFYVIPIAFVQSLANLEGIEKALPFLKPLVELPMVKSFIQGFLPGIALKIFLIVLPMILMFMSKFEGLISQSSLERRSASKYYIFLFFNVFLGSVITGSALEQLKTYLHKSANEYVLCLHIYLSGEILRLKPLIFFHLKNFFLVKTEKDREEAMDPGSICFDSCEPRIQLYFLLGLVYAAVTPFLLPFILVFFGFAYVVYRHQIINVYNQQYESGAQFWPSVHGRIITALIVSQLVLLGLLSTKGFEESTPVLLVLPVLTFWFHKYCKNRYEPAFVRNPLQEAMRKDTLERAREPNFDLKAYLASTYLHPVFKGDDHDDDRYSAVDADGWMEEEVIVPTKRHSRRTTPAQSKHDGSDGGLSSVPEKS